MKTLAALRMARFVRRERARGYAAARAENAELRRQLDDLLRQGEQDRSARESAEQEVQDLRSRLRQWEFTAPSPHAAEQMVLTANNDAARTSTALSRIEVDHAALKGVLALTEQERDGLAAEIVRLGAELDAAWEAERRARRDADELTAELAEQQRRYREAIRTRTADEREVAS